MREARAVAAGPEISKLFRLSFGRIHFLWIIQIHKSRLSVSSESTGWLAGHSSNRTRFKPIFLRMIAVVRVSVRWNSYLGQAEIIGKKDSFGLRTAATALFISGTRLNGKKA